MTKKNKKKIYKLLYITKSRNDIAEKEEEEKKKNERCQRSVKKRTQQGDQSYRESYRDRLETYFLYRCSSIIRLR